MSDGSRSRTGCITCRIRKKKCDEQRPSCNACHTRQLACYGYAEPPPPWYTNKANWKEVQESPEAKALKALAETRYRIRRKVGLEGRASEAGPSSVSSQQRVGGDLPSQPGSPYGFSPRGTSTGPNVWQLAPDTIWWDSKLKSLVPEPTSSSHEETRLLMLFVDVIHPITHTFYPVTTSRDRSWLLNRVISNEALYKSSLSVSACFEYSLTQSPRCDEIGIYEKVRTLQIAAVRELNDSITRFVAKQDVPLNEFIWQGIKLLDATIGLLNLEVWSMLAGTWELHYKAAKLILNHIELQSPMSYIESLQQDLPLERALREWAPEEEKKRSLNFCILNYAWIDVIAIATFGLHRYPACAFDYLPLIEDNTINIHKAIGCHSWIVALIIKIVRLEEWKLQQLDQTAIAHELYEQGTALSNQITNSIALLEHTHENILTTNSTLEEPIQLISILFAYAAQILLQVVILETERVGSIDQTYVNACLQRIEALPTRFRIRATWPYTIAGCMSTSEEQHSRFRRVLGQTMQECQPPGIAWKGVVVMESCWRLRAARRDPRIGWRETMEDMRAMVLLL